MQESIEEFPSPFRSLAMGLKPKWIDYNGHLNLAYYHVLFDRGVDEFFERVGLGPRYRETRGMTTFTVESHVCYLKELKPDATAYTVSQVIGVDHLRIHMFQELRHEDGWLSATLESLALSIDISGPKAAPFPDDIARTLDDVAKIHAKLPQPDRLGRRIAIPGR